MTPSDFELNSHPEFAKTYAYHFYDQLNDDLFPRENYFEKLSN